MAFNVLINGYEASQFPTSLPHSIDEPLAVIAQVHTYRSPVKQVCDGDQTLLRNRVLLLILTPCFPGARRGSPSPQTTSIGIDVSSSWKSEQDVEQNLLPSAPARAICSFTGTKLALVVETAARG